MRVANLILPGIIWPEFDDLDYILQGTNLDALTQLFIKAKHQTYALSYSDLIYASQFVDKTITLAANYAQHLGLPREKNYLIAEPTNLRADRDRLLIAESEILQLNEVEENDLLNALNMHFNQDEIYFHLISNHLWLVELPYDVSDLKSYALLDIIGNNIDDYLPKGTNGILIHRLLNEIQMLFHTLPTNQEREQDGLVIANSVWFWDKRYRKEPDQLATILTGANSESILACQNENQALLVDVAYFASRYRDSFAWVNKLNKIENEIIQPLSKLLKQRKIAQINLWVPVGHKIKQFSLTWIDLYKFWKTGDYKSIVSKWGVHDEL